ncbi:MAG: DUF4160 domain-containing protein [Chitinophagaceae bacterium]|nr:DUF4160 domain-containing protein [Anaerolineae bacterium]
MRLQGYEWRIFTHDHAPAHCHVKVGNGTIVLNLNDDASIRKIINKVKISYMKKVQDLIVEHLEFLLQEWAKIHETNEE